MRRSKLTMKIREYTDVDFAALRRMHASQGFDYAFPDLRDPLFVSKLVLEDGDGRAVMASLARLTCEMYLLVDRGVAADEPPASSDGNGNSRSRERCLGRERYAQLLALHQAGERDLIARGLHDAHAWLPPPVARRFGRRLAALGWIRDDGWTPYCKRFELK
jgi:hypothetical protein